MRTIIETAILATAIAALILIAVTATVAFAGSLAPPAIEPEPAPPAVYVPRERKERERCSVKERTGKLPRFVVTCEKGSRKWRKRVIDEKEYLDLGGQ